MKTKQNIETVTVWGTRDEITQKLVGLDGVTITDFGFDVYDTLQPVVELTFDPTRVGVSEIFHKISDPETNLGGIANAVGISSKERR